MYKEPTSDDVMAARRPQQVLRSAYEVFMDEQNIPIYRGIGVYDVLQLPSGA